MKVVIKVSRRSNLVEVNQKRSATVLKPIEEKNARGWSAKESLPNIKIEQEGEGSCGRASEEVRERVRRAQKVGHDACCQQYRRWGARGTCAGASRTADAGLKIDHCSKTRVVL